MRKRETNSTTLTWVCLSKTSKLCLKCRSISKRCQICIFWSFEEFFLWWWSLAFSRRRWDSYTSACRLDSLVSYSKRIERITYQSCLRIQSSFLWLLYQIFFASNQKSWEFSLINDFFSSFSELVVKETLIDWWKIEKFF